MGAVSLHGELEVDAAIADLRAALELAPGHIPALIQKERAVAAGGTW